MVDHRTRISHIQSKVVKQWLGVLVVVTVLVYVLQPVQEPLSPCPATGCAPAIVPIVHAAEPTTEPLSIEQKIRDAFPEDPDMSVRVAFCESSLNPEAKHKDSSAKGIFQIIRGTWNGYKCAGDPLIADDNIACARKIYLKNGWGKSSSWLASKPCWSK